MPFTPMLNLLSRKSSVSVDAEGPGSELVNVAQTQPYAGYGFNYPLLLISLIAKGYSRRKLPIL